MVYQAGPSIFTKRTLLILELSWLADRIPRHLVRAAASSPTSPSSCLRNIQEKASRIDRSVACHDIVWLFDIPKNNLQWLATQDILKGNPFAVSESKPLSNPLKFHEASHCHCSRDQLQNSCRHRCLPFMLRQSWCRDLVHQRSTGGSDATGRRSNSARCKLTCKEDLYMLIYILMFQHHCSLYDWSDVMNPSHSSVLF